MIDNSVSINSAKKFKELKRMTAFGKLIPKMNSRVTYHVRPGLPHTVRCPPIKQIDIGKYKANPAHCPIQKSSSNFTSNLSSTHYTHFSNYSIDPAHYERFAKSTVFIESRYMPINPAYSEDVTQSPSSGTYIDLFLNESPDGVIRGNGILIHDYDVDPKEQSVLVATAQHNICQYLDGFLNPTQDPNKAVLQNIATFIGSYYLDKPYYIFIKPDNIV